jgi:sugar (glycoside-pentoside-hexuronide) transporter
MSKIKSGSNEVGITQIFAYGASNFANQLSWMMVSSYLTYFYLEVFGLAAGTIAMIMLIARVWDGVNDPIMGGIIDKTHTKWGRFRPYILLGAPALVVTTILTFTVPDLAGTSKVIYALVTYILLGMSYTILSVPLQALPAVMTENRGKVSKLYSAYLFGMFAGMIILNLFTLPLVEFFGNGVAAAGYKSTATIYAFLSLPIYFAVFILCKENVKTERKEKVSFFAGLKETFKNKNLVMVILYTMISMGAYFTRLGIAVIYYINVIGNFRMITIYMMFPMFISLLILPITPKIISRYGYVKTTVAAMTLQAISGLLMFFGPIQSIPFVLFALTFFGLGGVGGPCGSAMIIDSVNDYDAKHGKRNDGIAFATNGLGVKIGTALGGAAGVAIIGVFGYIGGAEVTEHVKNGINIATNLIPPIFFMLSLIPMFFYNITEEKMEQVHKILSERNSKTKLTEIVEEEETVA